MRIIKLKVMLMQNNAEEICYSWNLVIIYNTVFTD
jgi:hypothetical protein